MAQAIELKATTRAGVGKGAARAVRRDKRVPGIIYGDKQTAEPISLDYKDLTLQYQKGNFLSTVLEVNVDGKKQRVIPRQIQLDAVRDFPLHVDFMRLGVGAKLRVRVPVRFTNHDKSPGLKRGGVLNVVRHDIEVYCPAEAIPEHIIANLDGLEIGSSLHISAMTLPDGVRPVIQNRDFTVATVAGSKADDEKAAETVAGAPVAADTAAAPAGDAAKAGGEAKAGDAKGKK